MDGEVKNGNVYEYKVSLRGMPSLEQWRKNDVKTVRAACDIVS